MYYKMYFNINYIKKMTEKAVLFEFEDHFLHGHLSFWFPKSLMTFVKGEIEFVTLLIPETFEFTLTNHAVDRKNDNKVIVSSSKEDVKSFMELFKKYDEDIRKKANII